MKEEFGARNIMVQGAQKVNMHLMFGVLALFADQYSNWQPELKKRATNPTKWIGALKVW